VTPSPPHPSSGISVVIPVRDDRDGLGALFEALAAQTVPPDEVIVVDGGSSDGSPEVVGRWESGLGGEVRLLSRPGSNIAEARNAGIAAARNEWIALTDAGCRPVAGWLEAIAAQRESADFVAGVLEVDWDTPFEHVLAVTHYPVAEELSGAGPLVRVSHRLFGRGHDPERVGGGYMAFRRPVWSRVGGFPEDLDTGEDRGFTAAVVHGGFRTVRAPGALVRWRPPDSWIGNAAMFFRYARGDVQIAGRGRHLARASAWAAGATAARAGGWAARGLTAAGALSYVALPLARARRAGIAPRHLALVPAVVALKDLAQIAGAAAGLVPLVRRSGHRR
jgi:cellulose synthase/poly-beta-1,6-N-acetylglucosamine synthase-like glycosyltransferase